MRGSKLLSYIALFLALAGFALPYKYFLYPEEDGAITYIDHWGYDLLETRVTLILTLLFGFAMVPGRASQAPKKRKAIVGFVIGTLLILLGVLGAIDFGRNDSWNAGPGFYLHAASALAAFFAALSALRRQPATASVVQAGG
jgi:hypothetical protein